MFVVPSLSVAQTIDPYQGVIRIALVTYLEAPLQVPPEAPVSPVIERKLSIREKVALEFQDDPRMVKVIQCESGFRQLDSAGNVLMSKTSDKGIMQLNQVHWKEAERLGLDIDNEDDNIAMGRIIYDRQGIGAWMALKSDCYKKV